ncbi:MAG: hypothetical protein E7812_14005 [Phenylobacterium sp.]|nr:MAG: hypothetical protein E7812_14005 [Phenylobacterium sp.]
MRTFACYITDDRFGVPVLSFIIAADALRARELALRELLESPHHQRIEMLENGQPIFVHARTPRPRTARAGRAAT